VPGVVLATAGLSAIVYALIEGERRHWGQVAGFITIPGLLVMGVVLLVLFLVWESRRREPLVPLRLFRDRTFAAATAITLITSFALYGFLLVFVIETQTVLGMSPLVSGLTALPWTLVLSAVAPVAGRLTDRVGGRILLRIGLFLYALGVAGVALLPQRSWDSWSYAGVLAFVGVGMGLTIAPTTTEALRGIPSEYAAPASGILNTARQVGAALGAAVVGAVLQNQLVSTLSRTPLAEAFQRAADHGLQLGAGQRAGVVAPPGLSAAAADQFTRDADELFAGAFLYAARWALLVAAGALLIGSALTVLIRRTVGPGATARSEATTAAERVHT
jgi:MFS family permease